MNEQHLRSEIKEFLEEQGIFNYFVTANHSTKLICLLAALNDYSFSDDMINDLPQFIPTEEEIKKYR